MTLQRKKAIVTGANRSIGRSIAIALAKEGADIVLSYHHDASGAAQTVDAIHKLGRECTCLQVDFTQNAAVANFFEQAIEVLGQIDILINNAGMLAREKIFEVTLEKMAQVIQVNTIAPFYLLQLSAKHMIAQKCSGSIVNISSISGTSTFPRGVAYAASKAALNKITQNTALELAQYNIRVNTIAPGVIAAGMNEDTATTNPELWQEYKSGIPLKRVGTPTDISNLAVFLASDKADWITGKIFEVDGGQVM
jgi:NAD(P)-dependent dehydrogenase (short-subunit alcohol dehydrogenase family)